MCPRALHFQERLGFDIDFLHDAPPFYGSVSRGEARLHLRFDSDRNVISFVTYG
jgi:hypothetical protein